MGINQPIDPVLLLATLRKAVQCGLSSEDIPSFEERILQELRAVERVSRKLWRGISGNSFDQYRAYLALKAIDEACLKQFVVSTSENINSVRIPGILTFCNKLHIDIDAVALKNDSSFSDQELSVSSRSAYSDLCENNDVIRKALRGVAAESFAFSSKTFRAIRWLEFLEDPTEFLAHIKAVQTATRLYTAIIEQNERQKRLAAIPLHLRFFPGSALFRSNIKDNTLIVTLNEAFIHAPEQVLQSLLRLAVSVGDKVDRQIMASYSSSEEYLGISRRLLQQSSPGNSELVLFHHLGILADRIERDYFSFPTGRPQLAWMNRPSYRTFGVYQASSDTIRISPALDHPDVPAFVVEYVLFHELVHARVGVRVRNGRHQIHSKRFKGVESQYARRDEAAAFLKDFSHKFYKWGAG